MSCSLRRFGRTSRSSSGSKFMPSKKPALILNNLNLLLSHLRHELNYNIFRILRRVLMILSKHHLFYFPCITFRPHFLLHSQDTIFYGGRFVYYRPMDITPCGLHWFFFVQEIHYLKPWLWCGGYVANHSPDGRMFW